jgi:hypothetical protein
MVMEGEIKLMFIIQIHFRRLFFITVITLVVSHNLSLLIKTDWKLPTFWLIIIVRLSQLFLGMSDLISEVYSVFKLHNNN